MKTASGAVLVTGGAGYLGNLIAKRCLERAERPVILWLHARDRAELADRAAGVRAALGPISESAIIRGGDLRSRDPFGDVEPTHIGQIVHAAAVTRFNVERDLAQAVNVDGAQMLYGFAARCPRLERLVLLSSIYACGLAAGTVCEAPLSDPPAFANHYEWSKWECERRLIEARSALPWTIARVATVVADTPCGRVVQYNAFHNTLKLLFYGLVSLIPGDEATPLYFVTARFAADAVLSMLEQAQIGDIFHVCHSADESATLGQLVDVAFERFRLDADFAARRILKPLFCDTRAFQLLVDGVDAVGGDVVRQGLASIMPFAAQLFSPKSFENRRLRDVYAAYRAPDAVALVRDTCDYLVRTRWGTRLEHAA